MTRLPQVAAGRQPMGLAQLGLWIGVLLAGLSVEFVAGTFVYAADGHVRLLTHLVVGALLMGWAIAIALRPALRPRGSLVAPALAVTAAGGAAAMASPIPRMALEGALGIAAAMGCCLLVFRMAEVAWLRARLEVVAIVLPSLLAVVLVAEALVAWVEWWGLVGQIQAPPLRFATGGAWLGGPNVAVVGLLAGYPMCVMLLRRRGAPVPVILAVFAAGLIALLLTGSRGGLLGLATMVLLLGAIAGGSRLRASVRAGGAGPNARRALWGIGATLAAGVLVIAAGATLGPGLLTRFDTVAGALDQRAGIWATGINAFLAHPLTGTGAGTFPVLAPAYAPPSAQSLVVPHAHNTAVHVLAELGLLGLASGVWLVGSIGHLLLRAYREPGSRPLVIAAVIGVASFGSASIVDHTLGLGAVGLLVLLPPALAVGRVHAPEPEARTSSPGTLVRVAPLLAVLIGAAATIGFDATFAAGIRADAAAARGSWIAAEAAYREVAAARTPLPLDLVGLGVASAHIGDYDAAKRALEAAIRLEPSSHTHVLLAAVLLRLGDVSTASSRARDALTIAPDDPVTAINAGAILERAGDTPGALDAYATAVTLSPELAASTWWQGPGRAVRPEQVIAEALRRSEGDSVRSALVLAFSGDARARAAAQELDTRDGAVVDALVTLMVDGPDAASAQFHQILASDPRHAQAALWLSRIERASGNEPEADRYLQWAMILAGWPAAHNPRVGSTIVEAGDATLRPVPSNYPWALYGRRGPGSVAVPGILSIEPWPLPASVMEAQ